LTNQIFYIMKTSMLFAFLLLFSFTVTSQVGISTTGNPPDASAGLDVNFANKGFLMPRLTADQIASIQNPALGLTVFNLAINKPVFFDGTQWRTYDGQAYSTCGYTLHISHVAGPVAPVAKDVTYSTVGGIAGETGKCWLKTNLGTSSQASYVDDASEASAGWYFQFNRLRGFKHDGASRTPDGWDASVPATGDWSAANDPCKYELGSVWRIPTQTEWINVLTVGNWASDWLGPWYSPLQLHYAGYLASADGSLADRGTTGYYWSSTQTQNGNGYNLNFAGSTCSVASADKRSGFPVRCVMCPSPAPETPVAGNNVASTAQIQWNWSGLGEYNGFKWSTQSDYATATNMGTGMTITQTGLTPGNTYTCYVWAYNECGYSLPLIMTANTLTSGCGVLTINHVAGNVAPVSKTVSYGTEINLPGEPGKCWITSNLGADHQATSSFDATEASAGWYWQFDHMQGYKHDGTTRTPNTTWNWIEGNNNWQSNNDPCTIELGSTWRIPTITEWSNVFSSGNWITIYEAYNSSLKLHTGGKLEYTNGSLTDRPGMGYWWSSSSAYVSQAYHIMSYQNQWAPVQTYPKASAMPLRCIKPQ
jgi:uncharacterized protein (TIGR02145 family)